MKNVFRSLISLTLGFLNSEIYIGVYTHTSIYLSISEASIREFTMPPIPNQHAKFRLAFSFPQLYLLLSPDKPGPHYPQYSFLFAYHPPTTYKSNNCPIHPGLLFILADCWPSPGCHLTAPHQ